MVTTIQLIDYLKSVNWKYTVTESLLYHQLERKQVLIRNLVQILSEFNIFIFYQPFSGIASGVRTVGTVT